ncbi:MAG: PAS domain S-box protein [Ignavibacteriae bacterium]|nr:PAS domain S-box protein [Ignavibacteriota bacterium]
MTTVLMALFQNAALLLAMMLVFDLITARAPIRARLLRQVLAGIILGGICIGLMMESMQLEEGIIFDTRSVLLSLTGLFLGPIPAVFAMCIAGVYRLALGGPGAVMGILVILATGTVGILWRRYTPNREKEIPVPELYGFGLVVHIVMLGLMLTLPIGTVQNAYTKIGAPVLLVYPLATVLLGRLLSARLQREAAADALVASEARYRGIFEAANVGKSITLPTGEVEVNRAFCEMLGYGREELRGKTWQELTPPEDVGPTQALLGPLLNGEQDAIRFEKRYVRKDGSLLFADVSAALQRDPYGHPTHFIVTVVDISERKTAERQLRDSEERFAKAFHVGPAGMTITRIVDGKFLDVNEAFLNMFGFTREEVIGHSSTELGMWTLEERAAIIRRQLAAGGLSSSELTATVKSGRRITVLFSSAPLTLNGEAHHITTMIDITDQKRSESEVRASDEKFSAAFHGNPTPFTIATLDGIFVDVNPAFERLTGFTRDHIIGKNAYELGLVTLDTRDHMVRILQSPGGSLRDFELEFLAADGTLRSILFSSETIQLQGIPHRLSSSQDITERKRAEDALHLYAERLANLHRIDQTIVRGVDAPDTITQDAILQLRELLHCTQVGVGFFDFESLDVRIFVTNNDEDVVLRKVLALPGELHVALAALDGHDGIQLENELPQSAVSSLVRMVLTIQARATVLAPIVSPHRVIGVLCLGWVAERNITAAEQDIAVEVANQISITIEQARLLQQSKRHAEELEERVRLRTLQLEAANNEMEAFSYSVSHDLRAPLRHISGYVELVHEQFPDGMPQKAKHYLDVVSDAAHRMAMLIDDLLQFSRTGRRELRHGSVDMNGLLHESIQELSPVTESRHVAWSIADLPRVSGDSSLLKQVWVNLLDNALKYTRPRHVTEIEVGFMRESHEVLFFVRDNGVGFDMQYANKLFSVFQRLHSLEEFEGTGIGLANVQRIVHKHGGRVWAESEPDKGAVFYFSIPERAQL